MDALRGLLSGATDLLPSESLVNTAGTLLVLLILGAVAVLDFRSQRQHLRVNNATDETKLPRLSLTDLAAFDGVQAPVVYCCLRGRVYDVSSSSNFAKDGAYSFLAGADATVGMAKMSHDRQHVNSLNFGNLTEKEWENVDGWVNYMDSKYRCVAMLEEYIKWDDKTK